MAKITQSSLPLRSPLAGLQDWYSSQCDGDWEHGFGIRICTLDNPGWSLSINLEDTDLEDVLFTELKENYDDELAWLICSEHEKTFGGSGGPRQLERMIQIFLDWVRANSAQ